MHALLFSVAILLATLACAMAQPPAEPNAKAQTMQELPAESIELECIDFGATSFQVRTKEGVVSVRMVNHQGVEFMQTHQGSLSAADLPKIVAETEKLQVLGDVVTFDFPLSACKQVDKKRFHCFGKGEEKELSGKKVKGFGIDTGFATYDNVGGRYERMIVTLSVIIDGELYSAMMEYLPKTCSLKL